MNNEIKLAYFAGLADGEANIGIYKSGKQFRPEFSIGMTCKETIFALKDFFKCGNIRFKKRKQPHHKDMWVFYATFKSAVKIIEQLLPYLITKKKEAEFVYSKRFIKKGVSR
jgi:hypothetical protein